MAILKSIPKAKYLAAAGVMVAIVGLSAPAAGNALLGTDKVDLGTGFSSESEDGDKSSVGVRALATDDLENLGVGAQAANRSEDGDESSVGTSLETTDNLENVATNTHASQRDEDGDGSDVNIGAESRDNLDDVNTNVGVRNQDDGDTSNFGVNFSFED